MKRFVFWSHFLSMGVQLSALSLDRPLWVHVMAGAFLVVNIAFAWAYREHA